MLWIIVMLICCLLSAVSEECNETEIIVGRLGKELEFKFLLSDLIDKYNKYIIEQFIEKTTQNEIQNKDLEKESYIHFKKKTDSLVTSTIYGNGKSTDSRTKIVMTKDGFVVKKTKLHKEDAGIYWIEFRYITLVQKALIITDKPIIKGQSQLYPVLKPEDNYISTIQLECHSVSTSIGECITMYTVWYKNGMRMTDVDPTLSQINVTIDHNGGNFICLATDYLPCYERLQTTTIYEVLNIEECNNVFESETFIVQPEYPPIVQLEPDQREITVNTNEDLEVRCSAKCQPNCKIRWEKDLQVLISSGSIFITENIYGKDLKIVNINSSHEGYYSCLVNNIHEENKKNFTLSVRETGNKGFITAIVVIVLAVIMAAVITIVFLVITTRLYQWENVTDGNWLSEDDSSEEHIYESIPDLDQDELLPETSRDNNSINGEPGTSTDNNSINGEPETSTDNNSRNGEPETSTDNTSINGEPETSTGNISRNGEPGTSTDNNSRNGELGTSTDNNSRNGKPETSTDNNSRNGKPGTSTDNNSRNGEPETSTDNNSRNGEPGTSTDNNSRNGEPETSTDNNSRNSEPGTSTDNNSRNGEQNVNPESHTYDSLQSNTSKRKRRHGRNPDSEHRYARLQRTPEWFRVLLRKEIAEAMSHEKQGDKQYRV